MLPTSFRLLLTSTLFEEFLKTRTQIPLLIIGGNIKKTILIGDSEVDSESAQNASIPFILLENGYTSKNKNQIKHDHIIKNFIGLEKLIERYIND